MHLTSALKGTATGALRVLRRAARKGRPLVWPPEQSLPVAGLDALAAQSIHYTLRSLDGDVAEAWLRALQLAQVAFDRLLHDLSEAQRNLRFWRSRLRAGSHGAFMLLSRGPAVFAADLLAALRPGPAHAAASDRIEERIMTLQVLSGQLSEALARVARAADLLRLQQQGGGFAAPLAAQRGPPGGQEDAAAMLQAARRCVDECIEQLRQALDGVLPEAAQLEEQAEATHRARQAALSQTFAGSIRRQRPDAAAAAAAAAAAPGVGAQQEVEALARTLGLSLDKRHEPTDARAALQGATVVAASRGPLVGVPAWVRMPSRYQRHWLKYAALAGVSLWGASFVYRHSRLAGSDDLEVWARGAADTLVGSWRAHLVEPVVALRDELSRPSGKYDNDKDSLLRMLQDFAADRPHFAAAAVATTAAAAASTGAAGGNAGQGGGSGGGGSGGSDSSGGSGSSGGRDSSGGSGSRSGGSGGGGGGGAPMGGAGLEVAGLPSEMDAVSSGMASVMRCYEAELKSPIRNLVAGDLARTLLIQVQRLKVDTEAAMLELDQILRANELSISLVAAVPSLLAGAFVLRGLYRLLLAPRQPNPKREAVPCRLAMVELGRALAVQASAARDAAAHGEEGGAPEQAQQLLLEAEGMAMYQLAQVHREAARVFRLRDATSRYSEWPHIQVDLLQLCKPGLAPAAKLGIQHAMLRNYALLQA